MPKDTRIILNFLRKHGVSKKIRRALGCAWTSIRRLTLALFEIAKSRKHFVSAMIVAIIAALILSRIPIAGGVLAGLCIVAGATMGMIAEFTGTVKAQ